MKPILFGRLALRARRAGGGMPMCGSPEERLKMCFWIRAAVLELNGLQPLQRNSYTEHRRIYLIACTLSHTNNVELEAAERREDAEGESESLVCSQGLNASAALLLAAAV